MAPYRPTLQVEVALGYGALDSSPSWTAVQTHGLEFSITRGRSTEFDQFQAATASIRLKDTDRRYDPLYSAGTYAGSLLPNVPIRITATDSGTVFPRFYGYVDSWDVDPRRNIGFNTVPATDGFKIIAQKTLPPSVYQTLIPAAGPLVYWPLGEADGPTAVDLSGNGINGTYTSARGRQHSDRSLVPYSSSGSLDIVEETAAALVVSDDAVWTNAGSTPMTVEFWVQSDVDLGTYLGTYVIAQQGHVSTTGDRWTVAYNPISQTTAVLHLYHGSATNTFTKFDIPRLDLASGPHHVAVGITSAGVASAYCDGVALVVNGTAATAAPLVRQKLIVGCDAPSASFASWLGQIAHLAVYDIAPSAVVADHYATSLRPWDGDTTGERLARVLDLIGWPSGLRDLDTGETVLGPADLAGMNAQAYLQLVNASEQGRWFMANDGAATFQDAAALRANTAANATFSDDGSDNPYLYGSLRYSKSDRPIVNEASVQRKYGFPQTATDATSIASYGTKTKTLSGLLMQTDGQSRALAERLVYRYKDPLVRVDSWTVNPQAKPAQWQQHLALELGDHVDLEVKPANVGTRDTIQMDLDQIRESATPSKYEFTFVGSPRDPNVLNYLTWGGTLSSQSWGTGVWA